MEFTFSRLDQLLQYLNISSIELFHAITHALLTIIVITLSLNYYAKLEPATCYNVKVTSFVWISLNGRH
jgi:hypothetical protein